MTVSIKVIDHNTLAEATFSCTKEEFKAHFEYKSVEAPSPWMLLCVPIRLDSVFDVICPSTYHLACNVDGVAKKIFIAILLLPGEILTLIFRCITLPYALMREEPYHSGLKLMHEKGVDPKFSPNHASIFMQLDSDPTNYYPVLFQFSFKQAVPQRLKANIDFICNQETIRKTANAFRNMHKGLPAYQNAQYYRLLETQYPHSKTKIHRNVHIPGGFYIDPDLEFEKLLIPVTYHYKSGNAHAVCLYANRNKREILLYDSSGGKCAIHYPELKEVIERVDQIYFNGKAKFKNLFKKHQKDPHGCARYQADFITYVMNGGDPKSYCNQEIDPLEIRQRTNEKAAFLERIVSKHMPCWQTDRFWIRSV